MLMLELWADYYWYQQQALSAVTRASHCHCSGCHEGKCHPTTTMKATHCHLQASSSTTTNVEKAVLLSSTIALAATIAAMIAGMGVVRSFNDVSFDFSGLLLDGRGVALLRR